MTFRARILAPLIAGALVLAAAGCATPTPGDETTPASPTATSQEPVEPTDTATPTPTAQADASASGIDGVAVGDSFAKATADLPGFEVLDPCPWIGSTAERGYQLVVQHDEATDETGRIVLVQVSVPTDTIDSVGPRTAEGIGIGSTVEEARDAYPGAEDLTDTVGDRAHLIVERAGESALFLTYRVDVGTIWSLTATTLDVPPYEPCA